MRNAGDGRRLNSRKRGRSATAMLSGPTFPPSAEVAFMGERASARLALGLVAAVAALDALAWESA